MNNHRPVAFTINWKGLKLEIALIETEKLLLHEEIIPSNLDILVNEIMEDGVLKSPVIVDQRSFIVLDGMHRVTALKKIGCHLTCVCFVDYSDPRILVDRWCRVSDRPFDIKELDRLSSEFSLTESIDSDISSDDKMLLVMQDRSIEIFPAVQGILSVFRLVVDIEAWLREQGIEIKYETERDAKEMLEKAKACFYIRPPRIEKHHVLDTVKMGRVFTYKSTRHIVPARPLNVNVPLGVLKDKNINIMNANSWLSKNLKRRPLHMLPAGNIRSGRRYEEDLYIFEED